MAGELHAGIAETSAPTPVQPLPRPLAVSSKNDVFLIDECKNNSHGLDNLWTTTSGLMRE